MSFGDSFRAAAQRGGGDEFDPPNGNYTVKIVDARALASKDDGREWRTVRLQILSGEHAGRQFEDFGPAGDHAGVRFDYATERLLAFGLDFSDIEDIEEISDLDTVMKEKLIGREAEVSVSHNGRFTNINVHGSRTGKSDIPTTNGDEPKEQPQASFSAAAGAKTDDSDVPF